MIISGISNPSSQMASLADSQMNTQANIQNNTQADTHKRPVGPVSGMDTETVKATSVKSFAYGALGMDHPDKVEEKQDDSYTAGQYLKAAATIGSVIALFV